MHRLTSYRWGWQLREHGGSTTGISGDAEGLAKNQMLAAAAAKYNDVIQAGGIDLAKNHKEAVELGKHHNLAGFVKNVKTNGIWDYKDSARFANFADKGLLAELVIGILALLRRAMGLT